MDVFPIYLLGDEGQSSRYKGVPVFDDNFSYFSLKPDVVTTHLNHLNETVQMRSHNISFYAE